MKSLIFGLFFIEALVFVTSLPSSLWRSPRNDSPVKPLFYGWFFDEKTAQDLAEITHNYLSVTYGSVTDFSQFLDESAHHENITSNPVKNYYQKPLDPNTGEFDPLYHITANYCGESDCSIYTEKVQKFLGQNFRTNMIGLFFTNRTYGIRVKLSEEQQSIFDEQKKYYYYNSANAVDENSDETFDSNMIFLKQRQEKTVLQIHNTETIMNEMNLKLSNYIDFIPQEENYHPTESRAHVTVGCAPGVSAVVTGLDLLQVIELEKDPLSVCNVYKLGYGVLTRINHPMCDIFVLYPSYRMETNTTFQVYNNPPLNSSNVPVQSHYYTLNFLQWISPYSIINSFMKWI